MNSEKEKFHIRTETLSTIGRVVIDTAQLSENQFETIVFRVVRGVIDYSRELDVFMTHSRGEAENAHELMIEKWRS